MTAELEIGRTRLSDGALAAALGKISEEDRLPEAHRSVLFMEGPVEVSMAMLAGDDATTDRLRAARVLRVFAPEWELYGRRLASPSGALDAETAGGFTYTEGPADGAGWTLRGVGPEEALDPLGQLLAARQPWGEGESDAWIEREPLEATGASEREAGPIERPERVFMAGKRVPDEDAWWEGRYGREIQYPTEAMAGNDSRRKDGSEQEDPPRELALEVVRHRHRGTTFWRWRRIVDRASEPLPHTGEER